jgi:hypothetical protein
MRTRKRLAAALTAVTAVTLAAAQTASADSYSLGTSTATGDQVVPGPGDPNAYGEPIVQGIRLTLGGSKGGLGKFSNSFFPWSATGTPTGIHVHRGVVGEAGPVIMELPLKPSTHAWSFGRATPDECVILKLARNPGLYYVDGHTDAYPDGALRAQLAPDPYNTGDQGQAAKLYKQTCKKKK